MVPPDLSHPLVSIRRLCIFRGLHRPPASYAADDEEEEEEAPLLPPSLLSASHLSHRVHPAHKHCTPPAGGTGEKPSSRLSYLIKNMLRHQKQNAVSAHKFTHLEGYLKLELSLSFIFVSLKNIFRGNEETNVFR